MKKKWILFFLSTIICGNLFACNILQESNSESNIEHTQIDSEQNHTSEDDIQTDSEQNNTLQENTEDNENVYDLKSYGTLTSKEQKFFAKESEQLVYFYTIEEFFFNDTVLNASLINEILQNIYQTYEQECIETAELYQIDQEDMETSDTIPYDSLCMMSIEYVGEDYISILYNDVSYMGGAHPYSRFDGITIDCKTGKEVLALEFFDKSEEDILIQISNKMGLDVIATWEDIDFYLTDTEIVFFYHMPNFWEDVVLPRES